MEANAYINSEMNPVVVKMSQKKMLYWERKNSHLCPRCGKPSEDGKVHCPECRARYREDARQARLFYKSLGLCSECGKNRVFKHEKTCPECRARKCNNKSRNRITEEQKERYYALYHKWYWRLSEQGICVKCGRRKAVEGKKMCGICAARAADRIRKSRMEKRYNATDLKSRIPKVEWYENGLCSMCGSPMDMDGVKVCSKCYAKLRYARSKRQHHKHDYIIFGSKKEACQKLRRRNKKYRKEMAECQNCYIPYRMYQSYLKPMKHMCVSSLKRDC